MLYILTGPTAVGKTQLSLDWAVQANAEIVSCDSLLCYRGMDIGTAKPSLAEQARVPHHCIDLVEPSERYSLGAFLERAAEAVADILGRGRRVLVTGGSGFYLKGFVQPVVDAIVIPDGIHQQVEAIRAQGGLEALVDALREVAPHDWDLIDTCNERRVVPALKRCLATGKGVAELRQQASVAPYPFAEFEVQCVLLQRSLPSLQQRISLRTREMLEAGLIAEVQHLKGMGFEANPSAAQSIGYRECLAHLRGEMDRDGLEAAINQNTLKLAKKQNKWFRHQMRFGRVVDLDTESVDPKSLFVLS